MAAGRWRVCEVWADRRDLIVVTVKSSWTLMSSHEVIAAFGERTSRTPVLRTLWCRALCVPATIVLGTRFLFTEIAVNKDKNRISYLKRVTSEITIFLAASGLRTGKTAHILRRSRNQSVLLLLYMNGSAR